MVALSMFLISQSISGLPFLILFLFLTFLQPISFNFRLFLLCVLLCLHLIKNLWWSTYIQIFFNFFFSFFLIIWFIFPWRFQLLINFDDWIALFSWTIGLLTLNSSLFCSFTLSEDNWPFDSLKVSLHNTTALLSFLYKFLKWLLNLIVNVFCVWFFLNFNILIMRLLGIVLLIDLL